MNDIVKTGKGFRLENLETSNMSYDTKQALISNIKAVTSYQYGYVTKNVVITPASSNQELVTNLSLASSFGKEALLVIQ